MSKIVDELFALFIDLVRRITFFDKEIETIFRQSQPCLRITKIKALVLKQRLQWYLL